MEDKKTLEMGLEDDSGKELRDRAERRQPTKKKKRRVLSTLQSPNFLVVGRLTTSKRPTGAFVSLRLSGTLQAKRKLLPLPTLETLASRLRFSVNFSQRLGRHAVANQPLEAGRSPEALGEGCEMIKRTTNETSRLHKSLSFIQS